MKANFLLQFFSMLLVIVGCSEIETEPNVVQKARINYSELYKDSIILQFDGDLLHEPMIIWEHYDIYALAYGRMKRHLTFSENHLIWDFESAEELKISQNIFDYVINSWEYDNMILRDTNNILIPCGEYYRISYASSRKKPQTRAGQCLTWNVSLNMLICSEIIENQVTGQLNDYIDLENSERWEYDGMGGMRIHGEGTIRSRYYSYNVSIIGTLPIENERHSINTYRSYGIGTNREIEAACNIDGAPLVSVTNRMDFQILYPSWH